MTKQSVKTLSENLPEDSNNEAGKVGKTPKDHGLGRVAYSDKQLTQQFALPIDTQGKTTREKWANTAYVLALRAKKAAQTYSKKDFNALYRLVLSAGIAFDKAFPPTSNTLGGNIVLQLFGSLGDGVAKQILEPPHPVIDITPVNTLSVEPLDDTTEGNVPSGKP